MNVARKVRSGTFALWLAGLLATGPAGCAESPLPVLDIDPDAVTVSGLSSGGYMAVQLHVARSSLFSGAGVIAGGPYACALGGIWPPLVTATTVCMDLEGDFIPFAGPPDVRASLQATSNAQSAGAIDNPANLADDPVYLFSGTRDRTVPTPVMDALEAYYGELADESAIAYEKSIGAGHGLATTDEGAACGTTGAPYLNDCDYDTAGTMLNHLYGGVLVPPGGQEGEAGVLLEFDQAPYLSGGSSPADVSLADSGYLYIPRSCAEGARCRLHVALHGCRQHAAAVGRSFVENAGYNRWAEVNDIVVLYPQTQPSTSLRPNRTNPRGCWDWWGYTGSGYAERSAPQIAAIAAMVMAIATPRSDETSQN